MEVNQNQLSELSNLVRISLELEKEIDDIENVLAEKTDRLQRLIQNDIPACMESLGFETITTGDGWKIEVKRDYEARISEANSAEALQWLVDNGFDGIIKHDVTVSFSKGEHEAAMDVASKLSEDGYAVKDKETVHAQTLKAWVREQKEQGTDIPDELFGIYPITKAKITKGK